MKQTNKNRTSHVQIRRPDRNRTKTITIVLLFQFIIFQCKESKAQLTTGNIVVEQVGDGTAALSSAATKVQLLQFSTAGLAQTGTGFFGSTGTPSSAPYNLVETGSGTSNGYLSLSSDKSFIVVSGYNGASGTAGIASSNAATNGRTIGKAFPNGTLTANGTFNALTANNYRSIVSNGSAYWLTGAAGIVYTATDITSGIATTATTIFGTNTRNGLIFNNTLFVSTSSSSFNGAGSNLGIYQVGTFNTLPTSLVAAGTATNIINSTSTGSPYAFAFSPNGLICYVADDRVIASGGGIQKWIYSGAFSTTTGWSGGTWSLAYTLNPSTGAATTFGARGLTVDFSGSNPILYATTTETALNRVVKITDGGASSAATLLATATANNIFRGICFAPATPCSNTTSSTSVTSCNSYTWANNNTTYTLSGTYTKTALIGSGPCMNTDTLKLTINNSNNSSLTQTACNSYSWNGTMYTTSGTYYNYTTGLTNCADTATLSLIVNHSNNSSTSQTACNSYTWNGTTYTASGTYYNYTTGSTNCADTASLSLIVNQSNNSSTSQTACNSYTWNGSTYTASGTYYNYTTGSTNCLDTATLVLTVNHSNNNSVSQSATGQYTWNGTTYTVGGTYYHYSTGSANCADTATLILTIIPLGSFSLNVAIDQLISCFGYNNGSIQADATPTGSYSYSLDGGTMTNATGFFDNIAPGSHTVCATDGFNTVCSTIVMTQPNALTVNLVTDETVSCLGNDGALTAIVTGGTTIIQPYLTTWSNAVNTSSIYSLSVTGLSATTYTVTVEDDNNCLASATATVGLTPAVVVSATATTIACFGGSSIITPTTSGGTGTISTSIDGGSFTVSAGTYTLTATDAKGCTATTVITVNEPSQISGSSSLIVCDSYSFGGVTYTTSGAYTHTFTAANSCDSIHTLNLTINYSTSIGNSNATACDSYTWNGSTYTTSGTYTYTFLNASGCMNMAILDLTLGNSTSMGNLTTSACDTYTWNGSTYTASGIFTFTSLNASGCSNTATLNLTLGNSTTIGNLTTNACDTYSWNGTTYTATGIFTFTTLNASGCTNTATLNLTLGNSTTNGNITTSACDTYPWNGNTYTTSGIYTSTSLNASGCTNTATLNLTLGNSTMNGNLTTSTCDTYTWNGSTYTVSGIYTFTSLNVSGCTNTATLNLTLGNSSTNGTLTTSACDSYTWNGSTFTVGGTYTFTSLNASGCTNTATLNLAIGNSTSTSQTVNSYISYTWANSGITYTASGIYTVTSVNASGCLHSATLNLTILTGVSIAPKVILSGAFDISTGLMYDSLRVNNLIPMTEPYSVAPFMKPQVAGPGGETVSAQTLAIPGNDAIVDWVFVELRSASNSSTLVATKRALLQRDGDIVNADGTSPLFFNGVAGGNYFVSIKHRNHLGVMSASSIALAFAPTSIDFTSPSFAVYTNPSIANAPRKIQGSLATLWPGDANNNKNVKYNGLSNDKEAVLLAVGAGSVNNVVSGYRSEDVNLDGKVKYNSTDNDRTVIGAQVGVANPNTIISQHTPN